jgi:hypothetical protein
MRSLNETLHWARCLPRLTQCPPSHCMAVAALTTVPSLPQHQEPAPQCPLSRRGIVCTAGALRGHTGAVGWAATARTHDRAQQIPLASMPAHIDHNAQQIPCGDHARSHRSQCSADPLWRSCPLTQITMLSRSLWRSCPLTQITMLSRSPVAIMPAHTDHNAQQIPCGDHARSHRSQCSADPLWRSCPLT